MNFSKKTSTYCEFETSHFSLTLKSYTPGKKILFRNSNAQANGGHHENHCIKSPSQLRQELIHFLPSECPGLC